MTPFITVALIAILALLLFLLTRRVRAGSAVLLRPLRGYAGLRSQIGKAIESGSQMHVTLGQASLVSDASPTSLSAVKVLDYLSRDTCNNATPPLATVGEGTLLPAAQASIYSAYQLAGNTEQYDTTAAQFVASDNDSIAYASGVGSLIHQEKVTSNIVMGRLGGELAFITEAASRKGLEQVIGSDDPTALAVATAVTNDPLIGEELLASGAYVEGDPAQLASLQLQDILRWIIALIILITALMQFL